MTTEAKALELAHRIAWRYKKSSDPAHSDTFTFNESTLLQFVGALAQQAVPEKFAMVPRDVVEEMANIELAAEEHDDNGPGSIVCHSCGESARMRWDNGGRLHSPADIVHSSACPAKWARGWLASQSQAQSNGEAHAAPQDSQGSVVEDGMPCPFCTDGQMIERRSMVCVGCKGDLVTKRQAGINSQVRQSNVPVQPNGEAQAAPQAEQQAGQDPAGRGADRPTYLLQLIDDLRRPLESMAASDLMDLHKRAADMLALRYTLAAQQAERKPLSQAAQDVLAERQRQISVEGWTPEHDDEHGDGAMALAAGSYCESAAKPALLRRAPGAAFAMPKLWPMSWDLSWWRPKNPRADLVRAGALILAEIERLDRAHGVGKEGA